MKKCRKKCIVLQDSFIIHKAHETIVDVIAYQGICFYAPKQQTQGFSSIGLAKLPWKTAVIQLLQYYQRCNCLRKDDTFQDVLYFDEHALGVCVLCFSQIVAGTAQQTPEGLAKYVTPLVKPGGPGIKPFLLMLGEPASCN